MRAIRQKVGSWFQAIGDKLNGKPINDIDYKTLNKLLLPESYHDSFEATGLKEMPNEWISSAVEKKELIPRELAGRGNVVLNGYMNKIEVIDFPYKGKLVYIQFRRRRWREQDGTHSYFNNYDLHPEGMKATKEFGIFLKELSRQERSEFFCAFPDIRLVRQEDVGMV